MAMPIKYDFADVAATAITEDALINELYKASTTADSSVLKLIADVDNDGGIQ